MFPIIVTYLSFYASHNANGTATGLITRRRFKYVFWVLMFAFFCFLKVKFCVYYCVYMRVTCASARDCVAFLPRNDLLCTEWDVKPLLTHSFTHYRFWSQAVLEVGRCAGSTASVAAWQG